jgi:K+-sensing histidine kinase KdpD
MVSVLQDHLRLTAIPSILTYFFQSGVESIDQKILDVQKRIDTERKMLEASRAIKVATRNQDVLRRTDNQIREAERSLLYFENMLQDLSAKKRQTNYTPSMSSTSTSSSAQTSSLRGSSTDPNRSLPPTPDSLRYASSHNTSNKSADYTRIRYSNLGELCSITLISAKTHCYFKIF